MFLYKDKLGVIFKWDNVDYVLLVLSSNYLTSVQATLIED